MVDLHRPGGKIRIQAALVKTRDARPRWLRYGSAPVAVALATLATVLIDHALPGHTKYLWFFTSYMFTAWYGGVRPALLNLLLTSLAMGYFVFPPLFSLAIESPADQFGLALYCVTAIAFFLFSRAGGFVREIVASSLERSSLGEMPLRIDEIEAQLTEHIAKAEMAERRLTVQVRVSQILTGSRNMEFAARPILQAVCEAAGWEAGLFWVFDQPSRKLQCIESWSLRTNLAEELQRTSRQYAYSNGEGFPGRVWAANRILRILDISKEIGFPRCTLLAAEMGMREVIGFPVGNGVEVLGVMEFFGRNVGEPNDQLVQLMTSIGNQISQFIEWRRAEKSVQEQNLERCSAREIQEGLLPTSMPRVPGFQIAGKAIFATEVGGDYFDFMPMSVKCEDCLGIVIGDAAGHGLASALLIAETRAYLNALAATLSQPDRMLALVNRRLTNGTESKHFVTLLLICLNPRKKVLAYSGAGHCPGYVLGHQGQTKAVLASAGLPLGLDLSSEYPMSSEIALEAGDLIVLYTDGIVETFSPENQLFGTERLLASVRQHRQCSPDRILNALFQAVTDHAQGRVQSDDITVVVLKVEPA